MTPSFRTLTAAAAVALAFAGVISADVSPPAASATPTGACVDDANATLVLSSAEGQKAFGGPVSCAFLASMHACNHPTHGARIREHCKATCGTCPDTCDPDDATVAVATDINITATVPVDDDDDRSASLTWGQYLYRELAAVKAAKDVLQRELFAEKIANFATVATMAKELAAEKAANKVLADAVSAAEGKADGATEQVAAMITLKDDLVKELTDAKDDLELELQVWRDYFDKAAGKLERAGLDWRECTADIDCPSERNPRCDPRSGFCTAN